MAKLTFTYGAMFSGKSAMAIQLANHLEHAGKKVVLYTFGDRNGLGKVTSRLGIEYEAISVLPTANVDVLNQILYHAQLNKIDAILIDEAQFATQEHVEFFAKIVDDLNIDAYCFGLSTNFLGKLFDGSAALFEVADEINELPLRTPCALCGACGIFNSRWVDGKLVNDGDLVVLDSAENDNVEYKVLCRKCFKL